MIPILYWLIWLFSLLATGMLFVWHLPFYPFSSPGATDSQGAVLMLMMAFVRWIAIAVLIAIASTLWLRRRAETSAWARRVVPVALVGGHVLLGLLNFLVWNNWIRWISEPGVHTPAGDKASAATYFAIPLVVLSLLAAAKWILPAEPEAGTPPGGTATNVTPNA